MMAKKGADETDTTKKIASKTLMTTIVSAAAVFAVRKLLAFGWQKATGKTPPDPTDPQVRVVEVLGWAAVAGVAVEATKLITARATARQVDCSPIDEA